MLSQSDDGGGLSLLDDDDSGSGSVGVEFSGDRDESRSFNSYEGEFGLGTTSGHFVIGDRVLVILGIAIHLLVLKVIIH
ncbi:hypothetical protein Godav_023416 [Gossypium davidsonii]|uniref:Uncharacterized protein n=1 Tax=Gossypium davidsonii TaxID=34287 RepID=A0A7J8ST58_GOSDV|nr:hypothetical protein [Gossypium davidsonii]